MEFDVDIEALKAAAFAVAPEQRLSEDCEAGGVGAALTARLR
jgi:hypothetical protein